jgi:hypothetical protein
MEGDVPMKNEKLKVVRGSGMYSAISGTKMPTPNSSRPSSRPKSSKC